MEGCMAERRDCTVSWEKGEQEKIASSVAPSRAHPSELRFPSKLHQLQVPPSPKVPLGTSLSTWAFDRHADAHWCQFSPLRGLTDHSFQTPVVRQDYGIIASAHWDPYTLCSLCPVLISLADYMSWKEQWYSTCSGEWQEQDRFYQVLQCQTLFIGTDLWLVYILSPVGSLLFSLFL